MVYTNQKEYYDAIQSATNRADSGPFIDFMLREILNTLKDYQGEALQEREGMIRDKVRDKVRDKFGISSGEIMDKILQNPNITLDEIALQLSVTRRSIEKKLKNFAKPEY